MIVFGLMPLTSYADGERFSVDNIYYQVISQGEQTVKVVAPSPGEYSGSINIPQTVTYNTKDYTVTEIGVEAFGESEAITDIVIPDTVKNIGINAFGGLKALRSLYIPAGVTSELGGAMTGLLGRNFTISYYYPDWPNVNVTFGSGSPYSLFRFNAGYMEVKIPLNIHR